MSLVVSNPTSEDNHVTGLHPPIAGHSPQAHIISIFILLMGVKGTRGFASSGFSRHA
jgi:hypothetical protein